MKKNDKLKIAVIIGLVLMIFSWFIAGGSYDANGNYVVGEITRPGILDYFTMIFYNFSSRLSNVLFILVIGGVYGVLSKTNSYRKLVDKTVNLVKGKEIIALLVTTLIMGIFTSVCSEVFVLFMFVPFIVTVFLKCGRDKITALCAAAGGIFIGTAGLTFGTYGVLNALQTFQIKVTDGIGFKIALFILAYALFNFFAIMHMNKQYKEVDETEDDMFVTESFDDKKVKKGKKTKIWPTVVVLAIAIVISVLAYINWNQSFSVKIFDTAFKNLKEFKINEIPILYNILGSFVEAFGSWSDLVPLAVTISLAAFIIALFNKRSIDEFINDFGEGVKKISKVAVIYAVVMIGFTVAYWYTWPINVIINIIGTGSFNMFKMLFASITGAFLLVDPEFMGYAIGQYILVNFPKNLVSANLLISSGYALVQVIAPTSFILMMLLTYLNIPYKKWLGYIWKYALSLLLIVVLVFAIMCYM